MGSTTVISSWLDAPQWVDGWPAVHGSGHVPRPSLWLVDPAYADTILADRHDHILDDSELARARRFHHPAHQIRFKTMHTALRLLLANATQSNAAELHFESGHHRKPQLSNGQNLSVSFNLSYTEKKSLIGISEGTAIGVDIEWLRRPMVIDDMMPACFSADEIRYITAQNENMHDRFFTLWTRKEAILKLTGEGIGEHLPFFEVLDGTCVAKKDIIGGNPPDRIYLYSFRLGEDHVGCYATSEPLDQLPIHQL